MGSKFQFLIGTVLRKNETNKIKKVQMFQFLIGTVLQQYFRRFPTLYSFFSL